MVVKLPEPNLDGAVSVESALFRRRSVREYGKEALALGEVSQILWAAQGITGRGRFRTAPSAGATYPLELFLATGEVESMSSGVYRYEPRMHELLKVVDGDKRAHLSIAALNQGFVRNAPAVLVLAAVYERTTERYGARGIQYVHMEAGHAAQNVSLQAEALKLGTVVIGAFQDEEVKIAVGLGKDVAPLILMPLGRLRA